MAWLTMSVQIGFVVGAFLSALFNVAGVWQPRLVCTVGVTVGAVANVLIAVVVTDLALALGPIFGIWAMWALKQLPAATQLAGGRG